MIDMVGECGSCEKDLKINRQRIPETRGKLRKERSENLSLEVRGGQRWSEERILPVGFILMRLRRKVD